MYYSATLIEKSALNNGKLVAGCGSFKNITIDGRLSFDNAAEVARHHLSKEAGFIGIFAIEKTSKIAHYKNLRIIGSDIKAADVLFLL